MEGLATVGIISTIVGSDEITNGDFGSTWLCIPELWGGGEISTIPGRTVVVHIDFGFVSSGCF